MDSGTQQLIQQLFSTVRALEARYEGRPFTPYGHLVGSLGEVIDAERYGLKLQAPSTKGHDAITADGQKVEIKATFGVKGSTKIGLREDHADLLLVLRLDTEGDPEEIYLGPTAPVWAAAHDTSSTIGQQQISVAALRRIRTDLGTTIVQNTAMTTAKKLALLRRLVTLTRDPQWRTEIGHYQEAVIVTASPSEHEEVQH